MKRIVISLLSIVLLASVCSATNLVDYTCSHGDTIYAGIPCELQFCIENDVLLGGLTWGAVLRFPENISLEYINQGNDGFGPVYGAMSIVPGSRANPDREVFDLSGFLVTETDMDGQAPDSIVIGGAALHNGLAPGEMQHMYSLHFIIHVPESFEGGALLADTGDVLGETLFFNVIVPQVTWEYGGKVFPIVKRDFIAGDTNLDWAVNIADAIFLVNYIFNGGDAPLCMNCADANGDCAVNIGDAVYLINYIFNSGDAPVVSDCVF